MDNKQAIEDIIRRDNNTMKAIDEIAFNHVFLEMTKEHSTRQLYEVINSKDTIMGMQQHYIRYYNKKLIEYCKIMREKEW